MLLVQLSSLFLLHCLSLPHITQELDELINFLCTRETCHGHGRCEAGCHEVRTSWMRCPPMRRFSAGRPLNLRRTEDLANQFAEAGQVQKVKELIEPLLETHRNPRFLFNLVLKAFANTGDLPGADAWYLRMLKSQVAVSGRTFGKLVKCAAKAGAAEAAEGWLRRAAAGGFQVSVPQLVSLVEAFARAQDGHRAKAWQQRLEAMETVLEMAGAPGAPGSHGTKVAEGASLMAWAHLGDLRKAALSTSQSSKFGKIQWIAMLDACAKSSLVTPFLPFLH